MKKMRASVFPSSSLIGMKPVVTVYLSTRAPMRSSWRVTTGGSSGFSLASSFAGRAGSSRRAAGSSRGAASGRGLGSCARAARRRERGIAFMGLELNYNVRGMRALVAAAALACLAAAPPGPPATALHVDGARLQTLLTSLARFGANPEGGVSRLGFSTEDQAARAWLMERMREAGLEVSVDAAANIHGRRRGRDASAPTLLFGSHIDSVPKGGNFDGDVGSMGALEVMLTLRDEKAVTRHPLEMVVWSNEEGVHYGKGLFGSRAAMRGPDAGELDQTDEQGVALAEWLRRYDLDPARIGEARIEPRSLAAYLELHIEQGGILYRRGLQIGVVEGIVGIDRFHVTVEGFANHAGTTPMDERHDALVAAARLVQAVREEVMADRKSTRLNSSHLGISYAVFCLKKKT